MILQIIIVTHYFFTRIVGKGNRDEFCIILVDTFLVERGGKDFLQFLCDKMKKCIYRSESKWIQKVMDLSI